MKNLVVEVAIQTVICPLNVKFWPPRDPHNSHMGHRPSQVDLYNRLSDRGELSLLFSPSEWCPESCRACLARHGIRRRKAALQKPPSRQHLSLPVPHAMLTSSISRHILISRPQSQHNCPRLLADTQPQPSTPTAEVKRALIHTQPLPRSRTFPK